MKQLWLKLAFSHYLELGVKISQKNKYIHSEGLEYYKYGFSKTCMEMNSMFSERSLYLK